MISSFTAWTDQHNDLVSMYVGRHLDEHPDVSADRLYQYLDLAFSRDYILSRVMFYRPYPYCKRQDVMSLSQINN
ncbi:hypothetical protein CJU90_2023 [Yarrowia sp. C11]|nr:hypothetical protein CJU90_2023 [Yarrowia sp. C11]